MHFYSDLIFPLILVLSLIDQYKIVLLVGVRYVRVLGAFYLRLTGTVTDVYQYLEPLYNDYRKIRMKLADGSKTLVILVLFYSIRFRSFFFI